MEKSKRFTCDKPFNKKIKGGRRSFRLFLNSMFLRHPIRHKKLYIKPSWVKRIRYIFFLY